MNPDTPFALGAIKSPSDYRDIPYAAVASATPLPAKFKTDMSQFAVWNQMKIGSCVAHAIAKAMQVYWFARTGKVINFSPRFLFALAKAQDGLPGDVGTYPRLVASIAKNVGCCTQEMFPNDSSLSFADYTDISKITPEMYTEAAQYKIGAYSFVYTPDEIRQAVYQHGAVALLMQIGKEWWTKKDGTSSYAIADIDPLRTPAAIVSGHEICVFGFEDNYQDIMNSWSLAWADNGANKFDAGSWIPFVQEGIVLLDAPPAVLDIVHQLPSPTNFHHNFTTQMDAGLRGQEVIYLQAALMLDGCFSSAEYAELLKEGALGYFRPGGDTQAAVQRFQVKYNIAAPGVPGYGRVGPKTLLQLNALFNK